MFSGLSSQKKLIQVVAGSAIAGLTISFIIGEMVDQKAKLLTVWRQDAKIFPAEYSFEKPLLATIDLISSDKVAEQLLAANKEAPAIQVAKEQPAVAPIPELKLGKTEKFDQKSLKKTMEMDRVHLSIQEATQKLTTKTETVIEDGTVTVSSAPSLESKSVGTASYIYVNGSKIPTIQNPVSVPKASSWAIQGTVKVANAQKQSGGHIEISAFASIDPDGAPIGAPTRQNILPFGQRNYKLKLPPDLDKAYLFGEFVAAKTGKRTPLFLNRPNPITPSGKGVIVADMSAAYGDQTASLSAAPQISSASHEMIKIRGKIATMFAKQRIPQDEVVVKIRGRKEAARSNKAGAFELTIPKVKGSLFIEFLKSGYHPTIYRYEVGDKEEIEINMAARSAVEQVANMVTVRQASNKGVFIGTVMGSDGLPLKGVSFQSSLRGEGPFYFSEEGIPTADRRQTSSDGRFIFFNLEPGIGFIEAQQADETIAPFSLSVVEGGEMLERKLVLDQGKIKGKLFNPIETRKKPVPIAGARVRIEGSTEWVNTDSQGSFSIGPLKLFKGETSVLEISAEKFHNHRYQLKNSQIISQAKDKNFYAFPASYIRSLAQTVDVDIDSTAGIILGMIVGPSLRIDALSDHSGMNSARDFYFDKKGSLRGGNHSMTDPNFGTFIIFNVPKGNTMLQGNDSTGSLTVSEGIGTGSSAISILME